MLKKQQSNTRVRKAGKYEDELLLILVERLKCLHSCKNKMCDCLDILTDRNVQEFVAQYLVQFESKKKYDQDSIILEWYKYAISASIGNSYLWFCLPYMSTLYADIDCLRALQKHRLCLLGMRSLMGIGDTRYRSIKAASSLGVMPRHKGAGKKSNVTIKNDDPRMIHLRHHFDYLHKLGEVRASQ